MKVKKQKKGISLIVLIITIIIMIILASAIIISLSNNGIIDKARKAVDLSNESGITEMLEITVSLLKQENKLNEENLKSELEKSFEDVEVTKDIDGSYTVGVKGIYFTIEDDKIIKGKYDKWDGTKLEPTSMTDNEIHIYKASELKWVQEQVTEGNSFEGYTIYLENDLDLGARESSGDTLDEKWKTDANKAVKWRPIGKTEELTLKAKFEGNNHVIKGVYVEETSNYNGIFGVCYSEIQDLSIKNSYIEGAGCTGGIAGVVIGNVTNCHNLNTTVVIIDGDENNYSIGGILGLNMGVVTDCTNSGNVLNKNITGTVLSQVGGIVGRIEGKKAIKIQRCVNTGKLSGKNGGVGGICGLISESVTDFLIDDCINRGEVTGKYTVGGILGITAGKNVVVKNCINLGNMSATYSDAGGIGGIVGYIYGADGQTTLTTVEKCFNVGNVIGSSELGGIIGKIEGEGVKTIIQFCYNKGNVIGESNIGSIIGYKEDTTVNTFRHLYYLSSLNLGAINGVDNVDNNVTSTIKDINTFEEFQTWIAQFE